MFQLINTFAFKSFNKSYLFVPQPEMTATFSEGYEMIKQRTRKKHHHRFTSAVRAALIFVPIGLY